MRWSDRQLAMLREMGIRVWSREAPGRDDEAGSGAEVLVAEEARPAPPVERVAAPVPAPASLAAPLRDLSPVPMPDSAEWLVVAEPFDSTGGAGDPSAAADQERLLDNMLHSIHVARGAPAREGRACHLPVGVHPSVDLDAAIARVQPRCILAFGRAAATALLGVDEPLGRLRERVHERGGIPVVVTFPLPYLLRHAADKPRAWADLCRAVGALG